MAGSYYVSDMGRIRDDLTCPAVWLIPLVVAAVQLTGSGRPRRRGGGGPDPHWAPLNWFGYLLLIAGPVALLLRTVYPYTVLLAVIAITWVYLAAGFRFGPVFLSLIVAFLSAATMGPRWRSYPLPLLGWAAVVGAIPLARGHDPLPAVAIGAIAAWLLVLVAVAEGIRQRRAVLVARRQRRAAIAREAQAEQDRQASQARLSIARELHAVLAHSLSMINVQSSVALGTARRPAGAAPASAAADQRCQQASDFRCALTGDGAAWRRCTADSADPRHRRPGRPGRYRSRYGPEGDHRRARGAPRRACADRRRRGAHRAGVTDQRGPTLDG